MKRRDFVKMCGSMLALVSASPKLLAQNLGTAQLYSRVLLMGKNDKPLKASSLKSGKTYIFHYPFAGTPCFLVNLNKPVPGMKITSTAVNNSAEDDSFDWPGGVGKKQSIVAFTAICSHQFSHPTKSTSFINFYHDESKVAGRKDVIVCCAHQTVFDPAEGAKVVLGPTKTPLTTIVLEHDKTTDQLYALGTIGKEYYQDYFRANKRELIQQYGRSVAKQSVQGKTTVVTMTEFSENMNLC